MIHSAKQILVAIALILAVVSFFAPLPWQVPTILLSIALLIP